VGCADRGAAGRCQRPTRAVEDRLDPLSIGRDLPAAVEVLQRVTDRLDRAVDEAKGEDARHILLWPVLQLGKHGGFDARHLVLVGQLQIPEGQEAHGGQLETLTASSATFQTYSSASSTLRSFGSGSRVW
jgi:hypothetical protein